MSLTEQQTERAAGALLGGAVGDSLRALSPDANPHLTGGDTELVICLADVAATGADLRDENALDQVAAAFLRRLDSPRPDISPQTSRVLHSVHGQPTAGLAAAMRGTAESYERTGRPVDDGSLMRTAPVALAYLREPAAMARAARAVCELTHHDPLAGDACVIWCEAIRQAILSGTFDGLRAGLDLIPPARRDAWLLRIDMAEWAEPQGPRSDGSCVTALQAAWSSIRHTPVPAEGGFACDHLRNALHAAIRTGTATAITGALLGARWGVSGIPLDWQRDVHRSADLVDAAVRITDGGRWPVVARMPPPISRLLDTAHPDDPGVILGNLGHDGRGADAVVSLCRTGHAQFPGAAHAEQIRVWLVDRPGVTLNPAFAVDQAAGLVATLRAEGKRVLLHGAAGQSRTAAVAARYASIIAGYDGTTAVDRIHQALAAHGAAMNAELAAAVIQLAADHLEYDDILEEPTSVDPLDELRAEAGHDPEARADLARELSNRSLTLGEQDRADEALTFAGEAVMHYRHLVAQSAEDPDHSRHLAQALSNWALALGRLERHDEAHAALTEAVAIHRTSADDGPGRQHLAIALTNLAHNHTEQRSWEDAIAPAWEAVALLRGLLQTGEGDDTTLGHLGAALTNWSNALRAADRGDEANEKLTEALQVAREHSGPASLVQYAQLLHNLGVDRGDDGAVDEAVTLLSEAESLLAAAAESEPGYRWMAAQTGYALGLRLAEAERPQPARDAFDRVVRWRRQLVADDPDRYQIDLARALRQLSCMHESLADDAGQIGDRQAHAAAALTAQAEAVTLMRDLTSREPQRRAEFADTLRDYADLLDTADRHADAAAARAEAER